MDNTSRILNDAQSMTALGLRQLADSTAHMTHLTLPERTALVEEISRVIPAGNVPSMVAAGLAHLPERIVPMQENRRNIALLMQGVQTFLDKAVYQAFFATPASVLAGYQMLLKLVGKDVENSFPEGTWQFYVEFGLREDTGRHACESLRFHQYLRQHLPMLATSDQLAALVSASAWLVRRYDALLTADWNEHTFLAYLSQKLNNFALEQAWLKVKPYGVPVDQPQLEYLDYVEYRQQIFRQFCAPYIANVSVTDIQREWHATMAAQARGTAREAYLRQMSIQSCLIPSEHSDTRMPIPLTQLKLGVIYHHVYTLIDLSNYDVDNPQALFDLREACAAIMSNPRYSERTVDRLLVRERRAAQPALRNTLPQHTQAELKLLQQAPVFINMDEVPSHWPLGFIRQGQRGIGDHALTMFMGSDSLIFDLSHIYFDGPWGMAVAEIMTNKAVRYAHRIQQITERTRPKRSTSLSLIPLALELPPNFVASPMVTKTTEVSAEATFANLDLLQEVRRSLQARNDKIQLTVNDLLLLYRSMFGRTYQVAMPLQAELQTLAQTGDPATQQAVQQVIVSIEHACQPNPAILIPIDASHINPRERIYPTTFRNPFMRIYDLHQHLIAALQDSTQHNLSAIELRHVRNEYMGLLYAFGELMRKYKDITLQGGSISTTAIKLLGGLPAAIQRLLDTVPERFDIVNDVIKGQEVFSNVGRVSALSSLSRFNTAKDDNERKTLVWGVLTTADGEMRISLRDFRPHIMALDAIGRVDLAQQVTQDYLDSFIANFNTFLGEMLFIARSTTKKRR